MHRNPSLRAVQKHRRIPFLLYWGFILSTYPRLMLETFIRSQFGRRYYSFRIVLKIFFILLVLPLFLWFPLMNYLFPALWPEPSYDMNGPTSFWAHYATWYVLAFAFIVFAIRKKKEAMKNWEQSSSPGVSFLFWRRIKLFGNPLTDRFIETIAEPLMMFLIGFILYRLGQRIGHVIMLSSVLFSLSYMYAYRIADENLMDMMDQQQSGIAQRDVLNDVKQPSPSTISTPLTTAPSTPETEDVF